MDDWLFLKGSHLFIRITDPIIGNRYDSESMINNKTITYTPL